MKRRFLRGGLALLGYAACRPLLAAAPVASPPPAAPAGTAAGRLLRVGPGQSLRTLAAAAAQARDGDTIEVDAGEYSGDVAVWTRDRLTVRGVGGPVRLLAAGASAEGKAIWVVRGDRMLIENIEFIGARVGDLNGAGIRHEKGALSVRQCRFLDNQNGILTSNDKTLELHVERCEFSGYTGREEGIFHNLYAGTIRRLSVSGCYFHAARVGHLLKSRAGENHIFYNRLTDESGGRASYELEFPAGGLAYVVGNLIQQGSLTENPHLIAFGAEGYKWPRNELHLVHNTLIDDRPRGGVFLRVKSGADRVRALNNLLVGKGSLESAAPGEYAANPNVDWDVFARAVRQDYRLRRGALPGVRLAVPDSAGGVDLAPRMEYVHPCQLRPLSGTATLPGALQSEAPA
ncbi:MAG: hypothetical protein OSW77_00415 [Proteobacteria bacterium]|nr:hypothetical protein [Pseudomonadota bacterium]